MEQTLKEYLLHRAGGPSYEGLLRFPRYFEIETVNACNARCPMCTIDDWDRRDGLMSDETFAKIADEIGAHNDEVYRVALYRDGEPLIDKKLPARVKLMKDAGVRKVGISTNVALLNPRKSEEILNAGLDEIILSIDSLYPKVYEAIRKNLDFFEVMENAYNFIKLRDSLGSQCQIWVRMIRQESNRAEWPDFHRFWTSKVRPTDRVDYRNIHNWGSQLVNFRPVVAADTEKPCVALWSLMVIFANGDVPLCNVDYSNKYPLGNIHQRSIAGLWQSQEQNRRRESHLDGKREGICKGCTVWSEEANAGAELLAA